MLIRKAGDKMTVCKVRFIITTSINASGSFVLMQERYKPRKSGAALISFGILISTSANRASQTPSSLYAASSKHIEMCSMPETVEIKE